MNTNSIRKTLNLFLVVGLMVLSCGGALPVEVQAAPLRSQSISVDTTWSTDKVLTTDVVVQSGATLTIAEGVDVMVDSSLPDLSPSAEGLSKLVEIIVRNGGGLVVEKGAKLRADKDRGWYGVVYKSGSSGNITSATISDGIVGVTLQAASVTIQGNTIQNMKGEESYTAGEDGGLAAGIVITGTTSASIISNTIATIHGGWGQDGANGVDGAPASDGSNGGDGGAGGAAYGIYIAEGATPLVSGNHISDIAAGKGGWGGDAGDGGDGWSGNTAGGEGGLGGDGGDGAVACGIGAPNAGDGWTIRKNTIGKVFAGQGGNGGNGGAGGNGASVTPGGSVEDGGDGGYGGSGGMGGAGGDAAGISVYPGVVVVQDNLISDTIGSGSGGPGGFGFAGGAGASGETSTVPGTPGGAGGSGGSGGYGGEGGNDGRVVGIQVKREFALRGDWRVPYYIVSGNTIDAFISAGGGGIGSPGGAGGDGGDGGDGYSSLSGYTTNGGAGGDGGAGGWVGTAGEADDAVGMHLALGLGSLVARNVVTFVSGASFSGYSTSLVGGEGGEGGDGGDGVVGGDGGDGGEGGYGNNVQDGGQAIGVLVDEVARFENNLIHNVYGGGGWDGSNGGAGGNGGAAGTGTTSDGQPGSGGDGGPGGLGGDTGFTTGMQVVGPFSSDTELVNNTIARIESFEIVGKGGTGGAAGMDGDNAATGVPGEDGIDGTERSVFGLDLLFFRITLVNNVVAYTGEGTSISSPNGSVTYGLYAGNPGDVTLTLDYNNIHGWDKDYDGVTPGTNDISQDPLFLDVDDNDFHLTKDSPCVDQGTSTFTDLTLPDDDFEGDTRPIGSSHDMGADEYVPCKPVTGVTISGPTTGETGTEYTFSADVSPMDASTPITYTWTPAPSSGQGTATAKYTWTTDGIKDFQVEASNCGGSGTAIGTYSITISAPPCVPVTGVDITGPTTGETGTEYTFSAVVSPSNADTPITYTWSPAPSSGQGTATAKYTWTTAGTKDIQINVSNCNGGGVATYKHTITIAAPPPPEYKLYLPLIMQPSRK